MKTAPLKALARLDAGTSDRRLATGMAMLVIAVLATLLLGGCTLVQLQADNRQFEQATIVAGRLAAAAGATGPFIVGAARLPAVAGAPAEVVHQVRLGEAGGYVLMLADGPHAIYAFEDRDGDGQAGADEPAAQWPLPLEAAGAPIVTGIDLALQSRHGGPANGPLTTLPPVPTSPPTFDTAIGAIARLNEPRWSIEAGLAGYWQPTATFRQIGGPIQFVDAWDPVRIPVLFVHGAGGSATDWGPLIATLDRRYQAWIFQYPSGTSLDSAAHLLYWNLLNLQWRTGFERLDIVAHSMGGLVVRRFLIDHGNQFPQIRHFVSLSTPWQGIDSAGTGVRHSPAVVPSWRDLQPDGDFLTRLFARPMPGHIRHALWFSYRDGGLFGGATDGTVSLASQLFPPAQAEAAVVTGFAEDHTGILSSPRVSAGLPAQLSGSAGPRSTGRIAVRWPATAGLASTAPTQTPFLVLEPAEAPRAYPLHWPLRAHGDHGEAAAVPAGDYLASLAAPAGRSWPQRQPITVRPGATTTLTFDVAPLGMLAGMIETDDGPRRPAGSLAGTGALPAGTRIRLDGPSGPREITATDTLADAPADMLSAWLDGRDIVAGSTFGFVGLPAGEYRFQIDAPGYRRATGTQRVEPGVPAHVAPIRLLRRAGEHSASRPLRCCS